MTNFMRELVLPLCVKVGEKRDHHLPEGGNVLLLRANQPEVYHLDHIETFGVPLCCQERVKVAVVVPVLNRVDDILFLTQYKPDPDSKPGFRLVGELWQCGYTWCHRVSNF